jgi:hypothetical protein
VAVARGGSDGATVTETGYFAVGSQLRRGRRMGVRDRPLGPFRAAVRITSELLKIVPRSYKKQHRKMKKISMTDDLKMAARKNSTHEPVQNSGITP